MTEPSSRPPDGEKLWISLCGDASSHTIELLDIVKGLKEELASIKPYNEIFLKASVD